MSQQSIHICHVAEDALETNPPMTMSFAKSILAQTFTCSKAMQLIAH